MGPGGILFGYTYNLLTFRGNQSSGSFGNGQNGLSFSTKSGGTIGGGYYGGSCIESNDSFINEYFEIGGAGGSSYMSGYSGFDSVFASPINRIEHSNSRYHYSGYSFTNIKAFSGLDTFNNPSGDSEEGHTGSGAILLTYLGPYSSKTVFSECKKYHLALFFIFLIYRNK